MASSQTLQRTMISAAIVLRMLAACAISVQASLRKPGWILQDVLFGFDLLHDMRMQHYVMRTCEDAEAAAESYCSRLSFAPPPGYCEKLKELFKEKASVARHRRQRDLAATDCTAEEIFQQYYNKHIQLSPHKVKTVADAIRAFEGTNVLVWGAGFDTRLWCELNRGGYTVVLEQNPQFTQFVKEGLPEDLQCHVFTIGYNVSMAQGASLIGKESLLTMTNLPEEVTSREWDVILVDAPTGFNNEQPGRSQSIYMSSVLGHDDTVVCVDDTQRYVEAVYSGHYLGQRYVNNIMLAGTDMSCFYS